MGPKLGRTRLSCGRISVESPTVILANVAASSFCGGRRVYQRAATVGIWRVRPIWWASRVYRSLITDETPAFAMRLTRRFALPRGRKREKGGRLLWEGEAPSEPLFIDLPSFKACLVSLTPQRNMASTTQFREEPDFRIQIFA